MYSVVLMMAMTGGGDLPDLGHRGGGCCGGGYGGCYGGGSGYGCCGGGGHHGGRSRGHGHKGGGCCGGGYGGCYGSGYSGCYGSGMGYGGCYGSGMGYGGCYGSGMGAGCMGGGMGAGCYGGQVAPIAPGTTAPSTTTPSTTTPKTTMDNAAPATIVVNVPADARLTIDGEVTTSTATQRVFVSPTLNPGREYHYTLKAEFRKDGKMVSVTKDVAVKAGNETRVNLDAEGLAKVASR